MRPDVVTFWHGPLDGLRQTCLRSQVAAGHKVTVYSFDSVPGLPDGVGNAEAEAILPHAFSERLRPPQPDGSWRDWTILQFSDFFRMRLMAENAGLWLDADVLLLKPVELDPAKPYFAWERPRQLGNSVLYLPPRDPIVTARWIDTPLRHSRRDLWSGRAHRARPPCRQIAARVAETVVLCGSCRTEIIFRTNGFFEAARRPRYHRPARLPERPRQPAAYCGQPLFLGGGEVCLISSSRRDP